MKIRSNISGAVYDVTRAGICIEIVYKGGSHKVLVLDVRQPAVNEFPMTPINATDMKGVLRQVLYHVYKTCMPEELKKVVKCADWVTAFTQFDGLRFPSVIDVVFDVDSDEYIGMFHAVVRGDSELTDSVLALLGMHGFSNVHCEVSYLPGALPRWKDVTHNWDDELEVGPYGEFNKTYLWLRTQKGLLGSETKALTEAEINEGIKARSNAIGDLYECAVFDDDGIAFAARAFTIVK